MVQSLGAADVHFSGGVLRFKGVDRDSKPLLGVRDAPALVVFISEIQEAPELEEDRDLCDSSSTVDDDCRPHETHTYGRTSQNDQDRPHQFMAQLTGMSAMVAYRGFVQGNRVNDGTISLAVSSMTPVGHYAFVQTPYGTTRETEVFQRCSSSGTGTCYWNQRLGVRSP